MGRISESEMPRDDSLETGDYLACLRDAEGLAGGLEAAEGVQIAGVEGGVDGEGETVFFLHHGEGGFCREGEVFLAFARYQIHDLEGDVVLQSRLRETRKGFAGMESVAWDAPGVCDFRGREGGGDTDIKLRFWLKLGLGNMLRLCVWLRER